MEQVAQMLGVELEEEFKLNDSDDYKYKITKDGMFMYSGFASDWFSANHILLGVLIGKYEIEKPILTDKEKEPKGLLVKLFLGGIGACFLTVLVTFLLEAIIPFLNVLYLLLIIYYM